MAYSTGPKLESGMREDNAFTYNVPCPAGVISGDVFLVSDRGYVVAYAQTDRDSDGYCSGTMGTNFAEKIPVTAEDGNGDVAVVPGDRLFLDGTTVNKDTTNGVVFATALEAITSGATKNIWVMWSGYETA